MDHESFRKMGYQVIDWIADYMADGYDGPVSSPMAPGDLLAKLPPLPPERGEPAAGVLEDFKNLILPGLTHWNDPRFFGYFPCNHSGPGILGDLLSAGLGVNAMSWATSPAATELEIRMMRWLGSLIGLDWPGCIQDTASTATLCSLLAAREQKVRVNQDGYYDTRPLVVYTTAQVNTSVIKATKIAGFGDRYLRRIATDENFAMDARAFEAGIEEDLGRGLIPCAAVATIGTTSSTGVDPVRKIAELCARHGIWLHVDAAMAGTAAILPEMRWLMDGVDLADSFVFNPHKWMFTNFDCSAFFCKDPNLLKHALATKADYLKTDHDAVVENFRDWGIQLGRRFRALKLWFVIRCYGAEGLRSKIRQHIQMARWFADQVRQHPRLFLVVEPKLNTVCFRMANDDCGKSLLAAINASGQAFLSQTVLNGHHVLRVSFGQTHSTFETAQKLWRLVERTLARMPD